MDTVSPSNLPPDKPLTGCASFEEDATPLQVPDVPQPKNRKMIASGSVYEQARQFWRDRRIVVAFALIVILALAVTNVAAIYFLRREQVVIVVDEEGNIITGPAVDFSKANKLHTISGLLATEALLERDPTGFALPEILEAIFTPQAAEKAKKEISTSLDDLKQRDIHQIADTRNVRVTSIKSEGKYQVYYIESTGQIIRDGVVSGQAFREVEPFTLLLRCVRNPRISANGRYPLVVYDYTYRKNATE